MLRTKIHRPCLTTDLITRSNLIDELNKNVYKPLTLVSAPAGYGKSMLISQWIEYNNIKHAWISLDEESNDLRTYLSYCVESIHTVFPDILINIQKMLSGPALPTVKLIYEEFVNALENLDENLVVVLDDYHQIKNHEIHELLDSYLKFPPENIHLVMITRRDPPLMISQMRLYDRIFELRVRQLAFDEMEIINLASISKHIDISEESASFLLERTEGWILGLKMILLASGEDHSIREVPIQNSKQIHDLSKFIEEDSLKQFSKEFRQVLLYSSLLDKFNAALVDYLLEHTQFKTHYNGATFIEELISKNLFIISLDHESMWYRFHHLFQEVLFHQLIDKVDNDQLNALYLTISDWQRANDFIDEAINYALRAKDFHKAAKILEENRYGKLNEEQWWVLEKWMKRFPENVVKQRPGLLSVQLFILAYSYRFLEMPSVLQLLEARLKDNPDNNYMGELYFHKGFVDLWVHADASSTLENLEKAKFFLTDWKFILRRLALYMAVAKQMEGRNSEIIDELGELIPGSRLTPLEYSKPMILLLSGKAKDTIRTVEEFNYSFIQSYNAHSEAWVNYLHGNALFQRFELPNAKKLLNKALTVNPFFQIRTAVDALIGRTLICYMTSQQKEGELLLERLFDFSREYKLVRLAESCEARINLLIGNTEQANYWAQNCNEEFHLGELLFLMEVPILTRVRVRMASNDMDEIRASLRDLANYHERMTSINNRYHLIDVMVLQVIGLYKLNDGSDIKTIMEQALELGLSQDFIRPFVEPGLLIKEVLSKITVEAKHKPFVKRIIHQIDIVFSNKTDKLNNKLPITTGSNDYKLSIRELEIVHEVSKGFRNKEIGDNLNISVETVKNHVKNSLRKLQVSNRAELVRKALNQKLIQ